VDLARIQEFKAALHFELAKLTESDALGAEDQATVQLDQQSVGRLSRMDALQRQALAQANKRRRDARRHRIIAALKRMEDHEFGQCEDCGEDIPFGRLKLDPTVMRCIECAG